MSKLDVDVGLQAVSICHANFVEVTSMLGVIQVHSELNQDCKNDNHNEQLHKVHKIGDVTQVPGPVEGASQSQDEVQVDGYGVGHFDEDVG